MAKELQSPKDASPSPESVVNGGAIIDSFSALDLPALHSVDSTKDALAPNARLTAASKSDQSTTPCTLGPATSISNDLHLPGQTSAFRPFITPASLVSTREISSSSHTQIVNTSTQLSVDDSLILPGTTSSLVLETNSPSSNHLNFLRESSSNHDENDDGRTTASAPPCTPAPEPHQQPQSPFRNSRQIKKIDLLAMSRSRQSDRADSARRDGRNSGFTFPAGRGLRTHSSLQLNLQQNGSLPVTDAVVSPERLANGTSSDASPNVDVVSVDEQPDPSRCTFSVHFHDLATAEQMLKCSLCGFITNNQKFYRRHKRLHSRQYHPNLIHCSLCDYSTSQIRKMKEHTITSHRLPHTLTSFNQSFTVPPSVHESANRHQVQGQMYISRGNSIFHPVTNRSVNVPAETAVSTTLSSASTLGFSAYIPTSQERMHVNTQADLPHPPRGSAMLGNYAPANEQPASGYMRSVISNLMSSHTDPNSNVTSSNLYLQAAKNLVQDSHMILPSNSSIPSVEETFNYRRFWNTNSSLSNNQNLPEAGFRKVKTEPRSAHMNTVPRNIYSTLGSIQKDRPAPSARRQSDPLDSESGMDLSSDDPTSSPQPDTGGSRVDARTSTETNHTDNTALVDGSTTEAQCSVPFIKIEFPPHGESCSYLSHSFCTRSDRGVQCEIISTSGLSNRQGRMQSETVSSAGGSACVETHCYFCGITFDDEVLYSIHIGCHSHTDPFVCNVCGKQCHNKYGFYSHIMRGHQARSST
ncbi:unnamed protein product [Candidula unifasciata]|uniref:C2H2-type domain-containing protein n=1 Tax=Candidula unifasciata TaxID=100452 RepID=A0A8S4A7G7_9EUPU|nr:unnamed protein product [Candidula unifasciata]